MEHQMALYLSARYTTQQFLQQIKARLDEELQVSISTLSMGILNSGLKYENLKETLTDNRLTYINAQLLVISLCDALNKEMRMLEIDGVNFLENEKQLENRMLCLRETLTRQIQNHIRKTV